MGCQRRLPIPSQRNDLARRSCTMAAQEDLRPPDSFPLNYSALRHSTILHPPPTAQCLLPKTHCDYNFAPACAPKPLDISTMKWITRADNLRAARIRSPSSPIPRYRFRGANLRLRSAVESSGSVVNSIRALFSRIASQVLSRQQLHATRRLRALSSPMRAGCAPKRAECALTTHQGAQHGKSLCIIDAQWHFVRAERAPLWSTAPRNCGACSPFTKVVREPACQGCIKHARASNTVPVA